MGISTELYSDKIDINFVDVNAVFVTFFDFCEPSIEILPPFFLLRETPEISDKIRKFVHICRSVRKLPVQY